MSVISMFYLQLLNSGVDSKILVGMISPWLFNIHMDGVVREVNVRMLEKWLERLSMNGGRFEINQLLFADDTALVADPEVL